MLLSPASSSPPPTQQRQEFVLDMSSFLSDADPRHRHPPVVDLESGLPHPHPHPHQQQHQQQPHQQPLLPPIPVGGQQQGVLPHHHQHGHQDQGRASGGGSGNNGGENSEDLSFSGIFSHLMETNPELRDFVGALEKYIKFLLVLLTKLAFDHCTGIITFVCLLLTFYNANSVVKQQVARQGRKNGLALLAVLVNLVACIVFICYVFMEERIYNCSLFLPPTKVDSVYDLLWLVGVNDFLLKFVAVIVKIGLIFIPGAVVPFPKRGKYFLFVERCSQLHRELVPIQVWLTYLLNGYESRIPGKVVGVILVAVYMVFKGRSIITTGRAFKVACEKLMQSRSFGRQPNNDQLKSSAGTCPICYDNYRAPTLLHCKHIFCEECLVTWFDREKTCPMCRAQVTDDPEWRDGSTSFFIQLY